MVIIESLLSDSYDLYSCSSLEVGLELLRIHSVTGASPVHRRIDSEAGDRTSSFGPIYRVRKRAIVVGLILRHTVEIDFEAFFG